MAAEPQRSRCLYEILGVPRDSSQDDIRSAYRKLALKLHPDKIAASGQNPNSGDATARFQELLHAYEVLSDPKERQFYDSHRSQILFSDPNSSNPRSSSSVFDLDLFSFFSNSAFSGFGDTGKGFFKVYGDVFGKIYSQELYFVKELGFDRDSVKPPPLIGNLESDYSQVTAFYGYWLGFCTVLDFAWVDEFDVSLGPNRRSRRAMEEENKKKRKKARKEYNDLVRDLAAFAKKRDKRVRDMQMKKTQEEEKRKEEEKVRRKEEERKKAERARAYEEPEWARIDEEEEEKAFGDMHGGDDVEDEEKKKTEFYCVVCNKKFKSDKQWKNHEQSKKHKEKVAELRVSFHEEEEEEEEEEVVDDNSGEVGEGENSSVVDELCQGVKDDMRFEEHSSMGNGDGRTVREELSGRRKDGLEFEEEGIEGEETEESDKGLELDEEASILEAMVSGRKNKKSDHLVMSDSPSNESVSQPIDDEQSSMGHDRRKGRRRQAARRGNDDAEGDGGDETVSEQTSGRREEDSEIQNGEDHFEKLNDGASCSLEGATSKGKGDQAMGKNQKHKKQPLDGKRPAQKETNVSKSSSKGRKQKGSTKAPSNDCDTCGESFDTRNKLFAHLGATGHASLKSR